MDGDVVGDVGFCFEGSTNRNVFLAGINLPTQTIQITSEAPNWCNTTGTQLWDIIACTQSFVSAWS